MDASKKTVFAAAAVTVLALAGLAGAQDRTPDVRMARQLVADASAFETFMSKASAIQPGFPNGKAVAEAVKVGASHDFRQLESGMIAYAAMAALQEPAFTQGVERAARDEGREALVRKLTEQPESALYLPAAERAGARAAAALATQGQPLADDGRRVKQAAYDVQHQSWSKAKIADAAGRLARAKQLSAASFQPSDNDKARLYKAVATRPTAGFGDTPTPVLARALAVAALAVLDQAGDDNAQALQPLLTETRSASCLKMAKLNLFQCLAVAGPHYEDVYCLGQHAMIDPGQCVSEAAGVAAPARGPVASR